MKYLVTVTWEATAQIEVDASSADDADIKVRALGLPWDQAIEGDGDHYWLDVNETQEKPHEKVRRSSIRRRPRQNSRR